MRAGVKILDQKDADKFAKDAERYANQATVSKRKARQVLRSLGIDPNTGDVKPMRCHD